VLAQLRHDLLRRVPLRSRHQPVLLPFGLPKCSALTLRMDRTTGGRTTLVIALDDDLAELVEARQAGNKPRALHLPEIALRAARAVSPEGARSHRSGRASRSPDGASGKETPDNDPVGDSTPAYGLLRAPQRSPRAGLALMRRGGSHARRSSRPAACVRRYAAHFSCLRTPRSPCKRPRRSELDTLLVTRCVRNVSEARRAESVSGWIPLR
jgi:hypothetical protein